MIRSVFEIIRKQVLRLLFGSGHIVSVYNCDVARRMGVIVGSDCRFIDSSPGTFSSEPYLIEIGNHVSMTHVQFITHDGAVWVFRNKEPDIEFFGRIVIGNNVFIGYGVTILLGTKIGDNSVVAAGAVVKGTFPDGVIIGGVPAKVLCTIEEYYQRNSKRFTHLRALHGNEKKEQVLKFLAEVAE